MGPQNVRHRGAHPADQKLFAPAHLPTLRQGVSDLSWLLSRGYPPHASLKLVGDHNALKERQRLAISRAACSDQQKEERGLRCLSLESIEGQSLLVDGFNLIITIEAALSGGVLIDCRDECIRDMSSVHGSYRSVIETEEAVCLISRALMAVKPGSVRWLLDQPISNSGRLAQRIRELALQYNWPWQVEVVMNPDKAMRSSNHIAVTADSNILDGVTRWVNLNSSIIQTYFPQAWIIDLGG